MAVSVKAGSTKTSSYAVKGTTTKDVWDSIVAQGIKVGGKSVAGVTKCTLSDPSGVKFDFKMSKKGAKHVAEASLKSAVVNYSCTIKVPSASGPKLSKAGATAWKKFHAGLVAHEKEHVASFGKEVAAMAKEMGALKVPGTGKSEKDAQKAAHKEWLKKYKAAFATSKNDARLDANAKKLDGGGHGPTLDTSIP